MRIPRWLVLLLLCLLIAFLFANPFTRRVILWLLPLGRGIDDLIELVALIAAAIVLFVKGWISLPVIGKWFKD